MRQGWTELYTGNVAAWLPANLAIYGLVPCERRVLAFASYTVLYTAVLSLWEESQAMAANQTRENGGKSEDKSYASDSDAVRSSPLENQTTSVNNKLPNVKVPKATVRD